MDKIGFAIITKEQDFLNHNLNQKEYHHIINNWSPPGKGLHLYPEIPVLSSLKIEQLKRIGFSFVVSNNERDTHGRIGGQRGVILVMNEDSFDSLFNQNIQSLFKVMNYLFISTLNNKKKFDPQTNFISKLESNTASEFIQQINKKRLQPRVNLNFILNNLNVLNSVKKHFTKFNKRPLIVGSKFKNKTDWNSSILPLLSLLLQRTINSSNYLPTFSTLTVGLTKSDFPLPDITFTISNPPSELETKWQHLFRGTKRVEPEIILKN